MPHVWISICYLLAVVNLKALAQSPGTSNTAINTHQSLLNQFQQSLVVRKLTLPVAQAFRNYLIAQEKTLPVASQGKKPAASRVNSVKVVATNQVTLVSDSFPNNIRWEKLGSLWGDGSINDVLLTRSGNVVLATEDHGVFVSTDAGKTWSQVCAQVSSARSLFLTNDNVLFLTSGNRVFTSMDDGDTWNLVLSGNPSESFNSFTEAPSIGLLICSSSTDSTWGRVLSTKDNGLTWQTVSQENDTLNYGWMGILKDSLLVVISSGSALYTRTFSDSVWSAQNLGIPKGAIILAAFARNDQILISWFADVYTYGILTSTDNGSTWRPFNTGLPQGIPWCLYVGLNDSLYAGLLGYGLYEYSTRTSSWNYQALNNNFPTVIRDSPYSNKLFVGDLDRGLYYSSTDRRGWSLTGVEQLRPISFAVSPEGIMYIGGDAGIISPSAWAPTSWSNNTTPAVFYKSTDNGSTWIALPNTVSDVGVGSISYDPMVSITTLPGGVVVFGEDSRHHTVNEHWGSGIGRPNGIQYSTDFGNTWGITIGELTWHDMLRTNERNEIFAVITGSLDPSADGVFLSNDGGATFQLMTSGTSWNYLYNLSIGPGGFCYVNDEDYAIRASTDYGQTWQTTNSPKSELVGYLTTDKKGRLYAEGLVQGIGCYWYYSDDHGTTWNSYGTDAGPVLYDQSLTYQVSVNSQGRTFVSGLNGASLYTCAGARAQWVQINYDTTESYLWGVYVDSSNYVYMLTEAGIYRSTIPSTEFKMGPTKPSLVAPVSGDSILNPFHPIKFSWTPSTSPNGDTIYYSIHIWSQGFDTTVANVGADSLLLEVNVFNPNIRYNWTVTAMNTDSFNVSNSSTFKRFNPTFTRPLSSNWNLVSWNIDPLNDSTTAILSGVMHNLGVALGFDQGGLTYDPTVPAKYNTLNVMDFLHGYWVKTNSMDTLTVLGAWVNPQTPIALNQGWNLVSYLPTQPDSTAHALITVPDSTINVQGFDGGALTYASSIPSEFNTLQVMSPGFGYWIKTKSADTLVYPSAVITTRATIKLMAHFSGMMKASSTVTPTRQWISLWGSAVKLNGQLIPVGTVVKAVDKNGIVCGQYTVQKMGKFGLMPIYGDDPETEVEEGPCPGGNFYIYIGDFKVPQAIKWTQFGDVVNFSDIVSVVGREIRNIPTEFDLHQNYPNPFNPTTTIKYDLPKNANVSLKIYNVLGQEVVTLMDENEKAGYYTVQWNGMLKSGFATSGVYFCTIRASSYNRSIKMLLVK